MSTRGCGYCQYCGYGGGSSDACLQPRTTCDYGSCEESAAVTITQQGSTRPMCETHGMRFAIVGWLTPR